jgi:probable selenium-dependent hydroxylase accessory protein YqeC
LTVDIPSVDVSIEKLLFPEQRGVLSLVGGGGKTSLLFHLAHSLARSGKRVLTTTTTKILVPSPDQSQTLLIDDDPEAILRQASCGLRTTSHITAAAHNLDNSKLQGFAPEAIRIFRESGLFDWILVEADGAARRPLKASAGHEPVIPPDTSVLVAVAGLEVLGQPLSEELVFRSALAAPLMGLAMGEIITASALARLLAHPCGSFKDAPPLSRRFIFLNKADSPGRCEQGEMVAAQLRQMVEPTADALIVGQAIDSVCVHAVHPLRVRQ